MEFDLHILPICSWHWKRYHKRSTVETAPWQYGWLELWVRTVFRVNSVLRMLSFTERRNALAAVESSLSGLSSVHATGRQDNNVFWNRKLNFVSFFLGALLASHSNYTWNGNYYYPWSGLTRQRENGEFSCSFFQTVNTQGICQKKVFTQGIYPKHRENFEVLKIKGCTRIVVGYSYNHLHWNQILSWGMTQ